MSTMRFITVRELAEAPGWPTESALRALIFNADRNGLAPAIRRVGRRVLVDVDAFWAWVNNQGAGHAA